jgi:KaiC/GvpD/RAD55 family RecA-like ATPase
MIAPQAERAKELRRSDRRALAGELDRLGVRWSPNGRDCRCPFHGDVNPSAGIFQDQGGVWKFHCFPCGLTLDCFDLEARRTGRPVAEVLADFCRENAPKATGCKGSDAVMGKPITAAPDGQPDRNYRRYPTPQAVYDAESGAYRLHTYSQPDTGAVELVVVGIREPEGRKRFVQAGPAGDGQGGFWKKSPPGPLPLYNRRRVRDASTVVVVEGETCVEALTPLLPVGWAATTSPGGATAAGRADWSPVAGRRVLLWPDNDPPDPKGVSPGAAYAASVLEIVGRLEPACECYRIDPGSLGLPDKGDAVDFLELRRAEGHTATDDLKAALDAVWDAADPSGGSADLWRFYEETIAGRREAVAWPWPQLSKLTHALLPGTITLVCGSKATGKSFLLLESLWHWLYNGHRVAVLELEDARDYHLNRVHAQVEGDGRLFDPEWVKANAAAVRESFRRRKPELDLVARVIDAPGEEAVQSTENVLTWMRSRLADGCRVLVIDPITAIASREPWVDDLSLLIPAKAMLRRYGASLVMATHPDRSRKNIARSEAYPRFTHTILTLNRHDRPLEAMVATESGNRLRGRFNRSLVIEKARNGRGTGVTLAYQWEGATLRFAESGLVVDGDGGPEE